MGDDFDLFPKRENLDPFSFGKKEKTAESDKPDSGEDLFGQEEQALGPLPDLSSTYLKASLRNHHYRFPIFPLVNRRQWSLLPPPGCPPFSRLPLRLLLSRMTLCLTS